MKKIPNLLLLAIANYYIQRGKSYAQHAAGEKPTTWKEECLEAIAKAAKKYGYGWMAIAGTFWFTKGKQIYKITEKSYPNWEKDSLQ
jgi:hypothetical protein